MAIPIGIHREDSPYKDQEISCRIVFPIFDQLKEKGLSPQSLLEGVPFDLDYIYNKHKWISWDAYTRILEKAKSILTEEDLIAIGYRIIFTPASRSLLLIVKHLTTPLNIFEFGTVKNGKIKGSRLKDRMLFSCMNATVKEVGKSHLQYEIIMDPGYELSETHFQIARGSLLAISTVHGGKEAQISVETLEDRAVFEILLPPNTSFTSRLRNWFRFGAARNQAVQELKMAMEELQRQNWKLREEVVRRKLVENDLQKTRTFSERLTQTMHSGFIVYDRNRKVVSVNPAYCKMVGYEAEELVNQEAPMQHWPEDIRDELEECMEQALQNKFKSFDSEFIHKSGKRFPVSIAPNLVLDETGEIDYLLVLAQDITAIKKAEKVLRDTNQLLEQKVIARTEALRQVNTALEQFVYFASHDLKEPVRMVNIYLQMLTKKIQDKLTEEERTYLGFAQDGANRLISMLHSLLDYSRLHAKESPREEVDLNEIVSNVLSNLETVIQEASVQLHIEKLPSLKSNAIQMTQVFQNLLQNAIKFRHPEEEAHIWISVKENPDTWQIQIRDNGIGIPPEYQDQVFEMFKRLHARTDYEGSGIGLAICKDIITRHGGKIWLESHQEGASQPRGTSFFFTLKKELQSQDLKVKGAELKG